MKLYYTTTHYAGECSSTIIFPELGYAVMTTDVEQTTEDLISHILTQEGIDYFKNKDISEELNDLYDSIPKILEFPDNFFKNK